MNLRINENTENFEEGSIVEVFDDPIQMNSLEGKAVLIERKLKQKDLEFWQVSFLAKPETICFRWVVPKDAR